MSMELMTKAFKVKVGNPLRKLILIKLADNASDLGECWPSFRHIAEQCEISRRSVISHIDALCEVGLLRKEPRMTSRGNSSNLYYLNFDGAGNSLGPGEKYAPPGAAGAPDGAARSLGGAEDSPGGGAGDAPRISHSFEPVIESINDPVKEPNQPCSQAQASKPVKRGSHDYSPEFEEAWEAYPKRAGGNPKPAAFRAWSARLKDGFTTAAMVEGVRRYAAYSRAVGKVGSEYVKQAATFFGPDHHFEEAWDIPAPLGSSRTGRLPVSGFREQDYGDSECNW